MMPFICIWYLLVDLILTDTTVILKEKMLIEKSTQPFNILHQSNLRKSHTARLKSMNKIPLI